MTNYTRIVISKTEVFSCCQKSRNLEMLEEELSNTDAPSPPPVPQATSKTTKKNHGTALRLHRLNKHDNPTSGAKVKAENQSEDGRRRSHSDGNIRKPFLTLVPEKKNFWRSLISPSKHSAPEQASTSPSAPPRNQPTGGTSLFAKMRKNRSKSPLLTTVKASLTLNKNCSETCIETGSCSQSCSHLHQTQAYTGTELPSRAIQQAAHDNETNINVPDEVSSKTQWTIYERYQKDQNVPAKNNLACLETKTADLLKIEGSNVGCSQLSEVRLGKESSSAGDPTPELALAERKLRKHSPGPEIPFISDNSSKAMALFGEELDTDSGPTPASCGAAPQLPPVSERPFKKVSGRRPLPTPSDSPDTPGGTHLPVQVINLETGIQSSCKLNTEEGRAEKVRVVHPPFPILPNVIIPGPLPNEASELASLKKVALIEKVDPAGTEDTKVIQKKDTISEKLKTFGATELEEGQRIMKATSETQNENSFNTAQSANEEKTPNEEDEILRKESGNQTVRDNSETREADGGTSTHGYYSSINVFIGKTELVQDVEKPGRKFESEAIKEDENERDSGFQGSDGSETKSIGSIGEKLNQGFCNEFGKQYCSENLLSHTDRRSLDSDSVKHAILNKLEKNDSSQGDFGFMSNDSEPERKEEYESLLDSYSQSGQKLEPFSEEHGLNEENIASSLPQLGKLEIENLESAAQKKALRPWKLFLHLPEETILLSQSSSCPERPSASLPGTLKRRRVPSPSKPLHSSELSTSFILHSSEEFQIPVGKRESGLDVNTRICGAESGIGKSFLRRSRSMDGAHVQFDSTSIPTKEFIAKSKQGKITYSFANLPDHKTDPGSRNSSSCSEPSNVTLPIIASSEALSPALPKNVPFEPAAPKKSTNTEAFRTSQAVHDKLRQPDLENSRGPAHSSMPNVTSVQLRRGKLPGRIQTTTDNQESINELSSSELSIFRRSMPCIESLPTKLKLFLERQILPPTKRHTICSSRRTGLFDSSSSFPTEKVNTRPDAPAKSEKYSHSNSVSRTKRHSVYGYPGHFSSHVLEADNTSATSLERREPEETGCISRHKRCSSSSLPSTFTSSLLLECVSGTTSRAAEQENEGSISSAWCQQNPCQPIHFTSTPSLTSEADNTISAAPEMNEDKESSIPRTKLQLIDCQNVRFYSTPSLASETYNIPAPFPRVMQLKVESWSRVTGQTKADVSVSGARSKCPPPILPKPKQRPRSLSDPTAKQSKKAKASDKAGIQNHKVCMSNLAEKYNTTANANSAAKSAISRDIVNADKIFDSVAPQKLTTTKRDVSDKNKNKLFSSVCADEVVNQTNPTDSVFEDEKAIEAGNKPNTSTCNLHRPLLLENSCTKPRLRSFDQPRPHSICSPIREECLAIAPVDSAVLKVVDDVSSTSDQYAAHPKCGPPVLSKRRRSDSLGKR